MYETTHESELARLDRLVRREGVDRLPAEWADVYLKGERPLSRVQVREMLAYYR